MGWSVVGLGRVCFGELFLGDFGVPFSPQNVPLGPYWLGKKIELSLEKLEIAHKSLDFCFILKKREAGVCRAFLGPWFLAVPSHIPQPLGLVRDASSKALPQTSGSRISGGGGWRPRRLGRNRPCR